MNCSSKISCSILSIFYPVIQYNMKFKDFFPISRRKWSIKIESDLLTFCLKEINRKKPAQISIYKGISCENLFFPFAIRHLDGKLRKITWMLIHTIHTVEKWIRNKKKFVGKARVSSRCKKIFFRGKQNIFFLFYVFSFTCQIFHFSFHYFHFSFEHFITNKLNFIHTLLNFHIFLHIYFFYILIFNQKKNVRRFFTKIIDIFINFPLKNNIFSYFPPFPTFLLSYKIKEN